MTINGQVFSKSPPHRLSHSAIFSKFRFLRSSHILMNPLLQLRQNRKTANNVSLLMNMVYFLRYSGFSFTAATENGILALHGAPPAVTRGRKSTPFGYAVKNGTRLRGVILQRRRMTLSMPLKTDPGLVKIILSAP